MLRKKLDPKWNEAIAVGVISQSEYNTALEQYNLLVLYAASNDIDVVEIPEEYVELRTLISIQRDTNPHNESIEGDFSYPFQLETINEYLKGFVESDVIAPTGRYVLTYEEIEEKYNGDVFKQLYYFGYPLDWQGKMTVDTAKNILFSYFNDYETAIPSAKEKAASVIKEHIGDLERKLETLKEFKKFLKNL